MWFRLAGIALVVWGLALAGWGAPIYVTHHGRPVHAAKDVTTGQLEDVTGGTVMAVLGVIVYRRKSEWWWR